jgi:hypothetical protein
MRPAALLVAALLVAALAPVPGSPAAASCAGPVLGIAGPAEPPELPPGDELTVTGRFFVDGCDDTGGQDAVLGCDEDHQEDHEVVTRMTHVDLVLRQRGREWPLGTADATRGGDISWEVRVPDGLRPGRARLVAGSSQVLMVVVPPR